MAYECYEIRYNIMVINNDLQWDAYIVGKCNVKRIKDISCNNNYLEYEVRFEDGSCTYIYNVGQSFYRENKS